MILPCSTTHTDHNTGQEMQEILRLTSKTAVLAVALLCSSSVTPTLAQDAAQPTAPPPAPWGARCSSDARTSTPDCVVEQRVVMSNTGQLLTAVTIRIPPDTKEPVMLIQTPFGLNLPAGVKLAIDDAPIATLPLQTCDAGGCYAAQVVSADFLAALERGNNLTVTFQDTAKRDIPVPVSLNGFTAAYQKIQG